MRNQLPTCTLSIIIFMSAPTIGLGQVVEDIAKAAAEAAFSEAERQIIEKYYELTDSIRSDENEGIDDDYISDDGSSNDKKKNKRKGEGKRSRLPRGITKKLERGGTLPPGHAKRYLPGDLERQLPAVQDGYERIESDGQVILTEIATGVIADIINLSKTPSNKSSEQRPLVNQDPTDESASKEKSGKKWWQFWKD